MSYSFSARGATAALALAVAAEQFAKVVESQPVHAADQGPALGAAVVFADLITPDETKDVVINMNGYLSWMQAVPEGETPDFTTASVTVSVSQIDRKV